MSKKIQSFYVFKFSSNRVKNAHYKINIDLKEARRNGEVISVSQNQVIESLFRIQNREYDTEEIKKLFDSKKKLKIKDSSLENINKLLEIENHIDKILFVPELISVQMDRKQHYQKIIENGIVVNGSKYVRLMCGSGHARRNTSIFIIEELELPLKKILNNGRDLNQPIIYAKNNAYFALSYSGKQSVTQPYSFCVIPDYEVKRLEVVDFINDDLTVEQREAELEFNIFDGMGIISPKMAQQWASDLEIDYTPSAFIIRNAFLKGMVAVFDFHRFSDQVGIHIIKDVWGNEVNIRDQDLVLTASQFKAWNSYKSCKDYTDNCKKNSMGFGITRYTPKQDADFIFTNYQFLQVLNLNQEDIVKLCNKTVEYLNGIVLENIDYALLYLLGRICNEPFDNNIYDKLNDNVTKALLLNNNLLRDSYIQNHLMHSLNRKIHDSYIGNLIVDGNYTMLVVDPFAFCEHVFSLPVRGLLARDEHYCDYWNNKDVSEVVALRAPLTWRSEVNNLHLKNTDWMKEWYNNLSNGVVILNVHGTDTARMSDCDADGDILMLTNNEQFVKNNYGGLPITYNKKKAEKKILDESELWKTDLLSYDTKIGYITNCSTTLYTMLNEYNEGTQEYSEILNRLKICRRLQGDQIDKAKGVEILSFPITWTNWSKDLSELDKSLLIDKRPYFMRYLYPDKNKAYRDYINGYIYSSNSKFGVPLVDLLSKDNKTEEERVFINRYHRNNSLLDNDSLMNNICHHMEKEVKELKIRKSFVDPNLSILLKNKDIEIDKEKLKQLYIIYKKYKTEKRYFRDLKDANGEEKYKTIEQYNKYIRQECMKISSNISELASLAVTICYEIVPSDNKYFAWSVFGEGIVLNVESNKNDPMFIPTLDPVGNIEYLGKRYSNKEIKLIEEEELDEYNF